MAAAYLENNIRSSEVDWSKVISAAKEDSQVFDRLAVKMKNFIRTAAYRASRRYVTESDEEWSLALLAFYEAVQSYREEKGSFPGFAYLVIRRRLQDYERKNYRDRNVISVPTETLDSQWEEGEVTRLDYEISARAEEKSLSEGPEGSALKQEILALGQQLEEYGFSFFDLAEASPKAQKTRDACGKAVRFLLKRTDLLRQMEEKKTLPVKDVTEATGLSRKLVDRHRRYIIAAVVILKGDYPELSEYVKKLRQGAEREENLLAAGAPPAVLCGLLLAAGL